VGVDGPVIEQPIFEKAFEDVTGLFTPDWGYGAIEC
jgi:hypothetical protein